MKHSIKRGSTSNRIRVFIQDSTSTTGGGLTGLAYNSASLTCYYIRDGDASATAVTLVTATVGTWTSGGFKEIDATNLPGLYELGLPNAAVASGNTVTFALKGATNMVIYPFEIDLNAFDNQDSVRLGLTSMPNAAAGGVGGLPTVDASNYVAGVQGDTKQTGDSFARIGAAGASLTALGDTRIAKLDATVSSRNATVPPTVALIRAEMDTNSTKLANLDAAVSSRSTYAGGAVASVTAAVTVGTNNDKSGYALSSSGVQAIWDSLTSALTTVGSVGKRISDYVDAAVSSRNATTPPTVAAIRAEMDANSTKLANLDATISSRSTYAGGDTAGTGTLLARLTLVRAGLLDNLDAAVSTRNATTPPTAAANASAVRTELTVELARIDATVSSRSTYGGGAVASVTAPVTVGTNNDKAGYGLSSNGVQAIWDALTSALTAPGSVGKRIADYLDVAVSSRNSSTPPTVAAIRAEMDTNSTKLANLDASISSRSTYAGGDTAGTTTLLGRLTASRAGYLDILNGLVAAIWAAVTDSSGTTTLLSRIASALTIISGKVDVNDKSGFGLSSAEREATATVVESHLLNEGDGQMLINAIVGAINNQNIDQTVLIAAMRADFERGGGMLALIAADYARRLGDYATSANVSAGGTQVSGLNNLSSVQAQAAATAALNAYHPPTRAEATSDKAEIIAAIPAAFNPATTPVIVGTIQPNVVNASALANDAVLEIQTGLALDATVAKNATVAKPGDAMALTTGERNAVRSGLALTTDVSAATSTVTSALGALHNLSQSEAQAAAAAALVAYGPARPSDLAVTVNGGFTPSDRTALDALPTLAEMSGLAVTVDTNAIGEIADGVSDAIGTALPAQVAAELRGRDGNLYDPTVTDADGHAIIGANVAISRGGVLLKAETTNAYGKILARGADQTGLKLPPANDYRVSIIAANCVPTGPRNLDLTAPVSETIALDALATIPIPSNPDTYNLIFSTSDWGVVRAGVKVTLSVRSGTKATVFGNAFDAFTPKSGITNEQGIFVFQIPDSASLPRDAKGSLLPYDVVCADPYVHKTFLMPALGDQYVSQLPSVR